MGYITVELDCIGQSGSYELYCYEYESNGYNDEKLSLDYLFGFVDFVLVEPMRVMITGGFR